jgi:hypothetical protein
MTQGALKDPKPHSGLGVIRVSFGTRTKIFSSQIDKNKRSIWVLLSYGTEKYPLNTDQNHQCQALKSTMRDVDIESTVHPQVVQ